MKINKLKYLILGLALVLVSSCDDFLTELNPNEPAKETFYTSLSATDETLTSVYQAMVPSGLLNTQYECYRADLSWPGYKRPQPANALYYAWYYHNYVSSDPQIKAKWNYLYTVIFRANQTLEALEYVKSTTNFTEDNEKSYEEQKGQALFFRGMAYQYLWISFRNKDMSKCAVLADKVATTTDEYYGKLSSPEVILTQSRKDLDEAYKLLPPRYEEGVSISLGTGRVTAAAAATLLGNSYLYQAKYDSAMVYYKDIIENPEYHLSLETDVNKINSYAGEFNCESIFEISYSHNHNTEISIWDDKALVNKLGHYCNDMSCASWIVNAYREEKMDPKDSRNYYDSIPDTNDPNETIRAMKPISLRNAYKIEVANDFITPKYEKITAEVVSTNPTGYGFGYYRNYDAWDDPESESGDWETGHNVVIDNLSEVYLNMAECYIEKGDIDNALALINKIRARWGLILLGTSTDISHTYDGITYNQETLRERYRNIERPLEMNIQGYEGRWNDLRRWGITENVFDKHANTTYYAHTYTCTVNGKKYSGRYILSDVPQEDVDYTTANTKDRVIDYEYDQAAKNISIEKENLHLYYPIPESEIQANQNINE